MVYSPVQSSLNLEIPGLKTLFTSRVRVKLLHLFLLQPNCRYHSRLLQRILEEDYQNIHRELTNLCNLRILRSRKTGRRKEYNLLRNSLFVPPLWLLIMKASPFIHSLRNRLQSQEYHQAYLFLPASGNLRLAVNRSRFDKSDSMNHLATDLDPPVLLDFDDLHPLPHPGFFLLDEQQTTSDFRLRQNENVVPQIPTLDMSED